VNIQKSILHCLLLSIILLNGLSSCRSNLTATPDKNPKITPDPCIINLDKPSELQLQIENIDELHDINVKWLVNSQEKQSNASTSYFHNTQKKTGVDLIEAIISANGSEIHHLKRECTIVTLAALTSTAFANQLTPATPSIATISAPATPTLLPCDSQYPPLDLPTWPKIYKANNFITLQNLYQEYYGKPQSFSDVYAIAYYNNRKALEGNSYNTIDPNRLAIDIGWSIFLPPPAWIDKYREFPLPILETPNQDLGDSMIDISGSSALSPLSFQIAKCFNQVTKFNHILVEPDSTKIGPFDYCQSDIIMFNGSVELNDETLKKYGCAGIKFKKFEVARYAITIIVNEESPNSKKIKDMPLTSGQLNALLLTATSWNEVRDDLDNQPINRYYPPKESGTFNIIRNTLFPDQEIKAGIPNPFGDENEYFLSDKVANDINSVGIAAYGSYQLNKTKLISIPIDGISPNPDTLEGESPTYPLIYPLYLYTGETNYNDSLLLQYFIHYYLTYEFDFMDKFGYFRPNKSNFLDNPSTIP